MIQKRKELKLSQQDVADYLGMSRPTYIKIEKGERALTSEEESKLQDLWDSIESPESYERNHIPEKNTEKFKQVLLYVLNKVGARPNIGETVLYKLLYFMDFDYYEKYEEQFMGLTYFKNTHGPVPREFKMIVDEMVLGGFLEKVSSKYFKFEQKKYLPLVEGSVSKLNAQEIEMIDSVLNRYGRKTVKEISDISHKDTPWLVAKDKEDLEYEQAFYRPENISVRDYGEV